MKQETLYTEVVTGMNPAELCAAIARLTEQAPVAKDAEIVFVDEEPLMALHLMVSTDETGQQFARLYLTDQLDCDSST